MKTKVIIVMISLSLFGLTACSSAVKEEYEKQKTVGEAEYERLLEQAEADVDAMISETDDSGESAPDEAKSTVEKPIEAEATVESNAETPVEYDELQQLYLSIDSNMNYAEMIELVQSTGLPYSEEKYNGSRTIQVAFAEEVTAQKYKDESDDYLEIVYVYPKDENSSNDVLEKYSFGTCAYNPDDCSLTLINHVSGSYFSYYEPGNYISDLGTTLDLDNDMSKEQQLDYYFKNK